MDSFQEQENMQWGKGKRNEHNCLVYSPLQRCNCSPFPRSYAVFPKLEACFCKTSEHGIVFFLPAISVCRALLGHCMCSVLHKSSQYLCIPFKLTNFRGEWNPFNMSPCRLLPTQSNSVFCCLWGGKNNSKKPPNQDRLFFAIPQILSIFQSLNPCPLLLPSGALCCQSVLPSLVTVQPQLGATHLHPCKRRTKPCNNWLATPRLFSTIYKQNWN